MKVNVKKVGVGLLLSYIALLFIAPATIMLLGGPVDFGNIMAYLIFSAPFFGVLLGWLLFLHLRKQPLPKTMKELKSHKKVQWTISRLSIVAAVFGIYLTQYAIEHSKFHDGWPDPVISNTGIGFIVGSAVLALILMGLQKGNYGIWMFGRNTSELDERQLRVRQRVFERAYSMLLLAVLIGLWIFSPSNPFVANRMIYTVIIFAIAMPSYVAAGQKDA